MLPTSVQVTAAEPAASAVLSTAGHQSRRRAVRLMWFLAALIIAISFAFPLYFMVSSSSKADPEVLASPIHWWPQHFQGLNQSPNPFQALPLPLSSSNTTPPHT